MNDCIFFWRLDFFFWTLSFDYYFRFFFWTLTLSVLRILILIFLLFLNQLVFLLMMNLLSNRSMSRRWLRSSFICGLLNLRLDEFLDCWFFGNLFGSIYINIGFPALFLFCFYIFGFFFNRGLSWILKYLHVCYMIWNLKSFQIIKFWWYFFNNLNWRKSTFNHKVGSWLKVLIIFDTLLFG